MFTVQIRTFYRKLCPFCRASVWAAASVNLPFDRTSANENALLARGSEDPRSEVLIGTFTT